MSASSTSPPIKSMSSFRIAPMKSFRKKSLGKSIPIESSVYNSVPFRNVSGMIKTNVAETFRVGWRYYNFTGLENIGERHRSVEFWEGNWTVRNHVGDTSHIMIKNGEWHDGWQQHKIDLQTERVSSRWNDGTVQEVEQIDENLVIWATSSKFAPCFAWERGVCGNHNFSTKGTELAEMAKSGDFTHYSSPYTREERFMKLDSTSHWVIEEFANDIDKWPEFVKWQRSADLDHYILDKYLLNMHGLLFLDTKLNQPGCCTMSKADALVTLFSCDAICCLPCIAKAFICPVTIPFHPRALWLTNKGLVERRHTGDGSLEFDLLEWDNIKVIHKVRDMNFTLKTCENQGCECCVITSFTLPGVQQFELQSASEHTVIPADPDMEYYTQVIPDHTINGAMKIDIDLLINMIIGGKNGKLPKRNATPKTECTPTANAMNRGEKIIEISQVKPETSKAHQKLHALSKMRDDKLITEGEFAQRKNKILDALVND